MAENLIDILIRSRSDALRDVRALKGELGGLRQEFAPLAGTAAEVENALTGVAAGFIEVFRAGQGQGIDLSEIFERIAAGGEDGEAALQEFAQVAGEIAPQAATRLAQNLGVASTALEALAQSEGVAGSAAAGATQGIGTAADASRDLAAGSRDAAGAQIDEASASRQAAGSVQAKGDAEERAAVGTQKHAQASRDVTGALRGARQGLDVVTQQLNQMVPGLQGVLQPLQGVERLLGGLGPAGLALGLVATAAAAAGGAALFMGKSLADDVEHLQNIERATGASIPNLQVLRQVLTDAGLSADSATFPLTNLNRAIAQGEPLLKALGITARDPVEALLQLSVAFAGSSDEALKTEVSTRLLGGRARELLQVADELAPAFARTEAAMRSAGALIDPDLTGKASKLDEEIDALGLSWKGVWTEMRGAAVPAASEIVRAIQGIINAAKAVPDLPFFRFLGDQSRQAKEAVKKDREEIERLIAQQGRSPIDAAGLARIAAFPRPALVAPPIAQPGDAGFVGPLLPKSSEEDRLARALREAEAHEAAAEAAKKRAEALKELADVMRGTGASASSAFAELEKLERAGQLASVLEQVTSAAAEASGALDFRDLGGKAGEEFAALEGDLGSLNDEITQLAKVSGLPPAFVRSLVEGRDSADVLARSLASIGIDLPADFVSDLEGARSAMDLLAESVKDLSDQGEKLKQFNLEVAEIAKATGFDPEFVASLLKAEQQADATAGAFRRLGLEQPKTPEDRQEERRREHEESVQERLELIHDPEALARVREDWALTLEEITTSAAATDAMLGGLFSGLQSGLTSVFQSVLEGGQAFRASLVNLFRSMINEILAQLARLAAAEIFKIFIQLALGGPGGAAVSAAIAAGSGIPGGGVGPRNPPAPVPDFSARPSSTPSPAQQTRILEQHVTLQIEALDPGSFFDYMNSPLGKGRLAELRGQMTQGF